MTENMNSSFFSITLLLHIRRVAHLLGLFPLLNVYVNTIRPKPRFIWPTVTLTFFPKETI